MQFHRKGNETIQVQHVSGGACVHGSCKEGAGEDDTYRWGAEGQSLLYHSTPKAIAVCQKHIRIVDRSDLGWAVVEAYMDDKLASNLDNERKLFKASREVQQTVKRKQAKSAAAAAAKRRLCWAGNCNPKLAQAKYLVKGSSQQQWDRGWLGLVTGVASRGIWWPALRNNPSQVCLIFYNRIVGQQVYCQGHSEASYL